MAPPRKGLPQYPKRSDPRVDDAVQRLIDRAVGNMRPGHGPARAPAPECDWCLDPDYVPIAGHWRACQAHIHRLIPRSNTTRIGSDGTWYDETPPPGIYWSAGHGADRNTRAQSPQGRISSLPQMRGSPGQRER